MNRVRMRDAQAAAEARAAAALRPGDPVRAKRAINVGTVEAPNVIAHAGDEGTIVGRAKLSPRMLEVRFGNESAVCLAREITPDWE